MSLSKETINMVRYSLVVCRNHQKKYLCVQERNKRWWIVGGAVEKGETYAQAALREAKEEAAIDIQLKGILAIDSVNFGSPAMRVIFYAEPTQENMQPKAIADNDSLCAKFLSVAEIISLRGEWRAPEIYNYAKYL